MILAPHEVREARATLGQMWGLGRDLHESELGLALELRADRAGDAIRHMEHHPHRVTGPASVAILAMLDGFVPDIVPGGDREPILDAVEAYFDLMETEHG